MKIELVVVFIDVVVVVFIDFVVDNILFIL